MELQTTNGGWGCGFSDMFVSVAFPQWSSLIASPPVTTAAAAEKYWFGPINSYSLRTVSLAPPR